MTDFLPLDIFSFIFYSARMVLEALNSFLIDFETYLIPLKLFSRHDLSFKMKFGH